MKEKSLGKDVLHPRGDLQPQKKSFLHPSPKIVREEKKKELERKEKDTKYDEGDASLGRRTKKER